jgi:hypothetical protein
MRTYVLSQAIRVQNGTGTNLLTAWAIANAVIETADGAWLATLDCQMLVPLLDAYRRQIPAPEGWRTAIAYEIFAARRSCYHMFTDESLS